MKGFFDLLKQTWQACMEIKIPLIVGAVVFGVVIFLSQGLLEQKMSSGLGGVLNDMEYRMEELSRRAEMGDEAALNEMMGEMEELGQGFDPGSEMATTFLTSVFPASFLFMVVLFVLYMLSFTYFLILAVERIQGFGALAGETTKKFLPILGIGVWIFLRSFIWIPIVGFFLAIYFLPRLMFGQVIYMKENTGILASVSASWQRTKGKWLQAFGYFIGIVVVSWIASAVFTIVAAFTGPARDMLMAIFGQLLYGFTVVYVVFLADKLVMKGAPQPQSVSAAPPPIPPQQPQSTPPSQPPSETPPA